MNMRIRDLYNRLAAYVEDVKTCHREIERQKLMLDRSRIVLVDDFLDCVFEFAGENVLTRQLSRHMADFTENLLLKTLSYSLPFFAIPPGRVDEQTRERRRSTILLSGSRAAVWAESGALLTRPEEGAARGQTPGYEPSHYMAAYLGDFLECLNTMDGYSHYLDSAARLFLLTGDGRDVVEFWKNVNNLKDYSHLFPNRPPPPNNGEKQKEREAGKQEDWKPVFVPGGA